MYRKFSRFAPIVLFSSLAAIALQAAPQLRLQVPNTLERPLFFVAGSNSPFAPSGGDFSFQAFNAGDGTLSVAADGGASPWLTPQVDGPAPCPFDGSLICQRVRVVFVVAALAPGAYEGEVVVTAADAVDAPQTVPITIHIGGNVPASINFFVSPVAGSVDSIDFETPESAAPTLGVAGAFLTATSSNLGSFRVLHTHRVIGAYQSGLPEGDLPGSISVSGSAFAPDNRTIPATLSVTSQPISQLSSPLVSFQTAAELVAGDQVLGLSNRGMGDLALAGADVTTDNGGEWLSTEDLGNNLLAVRANVAGLEAGLYTGELTVNSNAANSPQLVPVELRIKAEQGPILFFRSGVNGANFEPTRPLTGGAIASLFGEQLSFAFVQALETPLPTELGGAKVIIEGVEAPIFFASFGQINFQVPWGLTPGGKTLHVERDGVAGNEISVIIGDFSAGLFRFNIAEYGAIRNASQGNFPLLVAIGQQFNIGAAPARPGDVLEVFATGLGAVSVAVDSGAEAPASPLASALTIPLVNFSRSVVGTRATPIFVGLTPGFVGLFQVNVIVPAGAATNARTPVTLEYPDGNRSNTVEIAVER